MGKKPSALVDYSAIPPDFPRRKPLHVPPHGKDGLYFSYFAGQYYGPGCSPPEVWQSWQICEELAQHFKKECLKEIRRSPLIPESEVIELYYENTLKLGWGTDAEVAWIFRRVAQLLGSPLPERAKA
jgi:hypothetical protein